MNRYFVSILAITAAAYSLQASAETPTVATETFTSSATRAQVRADLLAHKQANVNWWSTSYSPLRSFRSDRTRAEVIAEYVANRDEVAATTGEDSGSAYFAQALPQRHDDSTTLAGQFVPSN